MKVTVKVTEEMADPLNMSIKKGCMVSQALDSLISDDYAAFTSLCSARLCERYGERIHTIRLPHEVTKRIYAYDAGQNLGPFEFEADIPAKFLKERAGK